MVSSRLVTADPKGSCSFRFDQTSLGVFRQLLSWDASLHSEESFCGGWASDVDKIDGSLRVGLKIQTHIVIFHSLQFG